MVFKVENLILPENTLKCISCYSSHTIAKSMVIITMTISVLVFFSRLRSCSIFHVQRAGAYRKLLPYVLQKTLDIYCYRSVPYSFVFAFCKGLYIYVCHFMYILFYIGLFSIEEFDLSATFLINTGCWIIWRNMINQVWPGPWFVVNVWIAC